MNYEFHPIASIFPLFSDAELAALAADIKQRGLKDPVTIFEDQVLDGRNRYTACTMAGVEPDTVQFHGSHEEAVHFVWSKNRTRRHLSSSQAAIAEGIKERFLDYYAEQIEQQKADAKERQKEAGSAQASRGKEGGRGKKKPLPQRIGEGVSSPAQAAIAEAKKNAKKHASETDDLRAKASGTNRQYLADARKLIDNHPDKVIEIESGRKTIPQVKRELRIEEEKKLREKRAEQARKIVGNGDDYGVKVGDFREIAASIPGGSVDLIFTDPPYDRKSLSVYGDMASEADRMLCDGGSLICYLGQFQIHEVLALVTPHLRLWWTLAVQHTGRKCRMFEYGVVVNWKPLLWFVKGTRGDKETFVDDLVISDRQKDHHEWQQSVREARYYIEHLCPAGGLVFDPFAGGGTTAVAAKQAGRRWLTCDVDETSALISRQRIAEVDQ